MLRMWSEILLNYLKNSKLALLEPRERGRQGRGQGLGTFGSGMALWVLGLFSTKMEKTLKRNRPDGRFIRITWSW